MSQFPYTDETGRRVRPAPLTFEIEWLDYKRKVIGRDEIRKVDLSAAINYACNQLKAAKRSPIWDAHGFFVQSKREEMMQR
jgi:hypothetical protein